MGFPIQERCHLYIESGPRCSSIWPPKLQEHVPIKVSTQIKPTNHFLSGNTNWIRLQCREALLAVSEIPIWRYHSHVTVLSALGINFPEKMASILQKAESQGAHLLPTEIHDWLPLNGPVYSSNNLIATIAQIWDSGAQRNCSRKFCPAQKNCQSQYTKIITRWNLKNDVICDWPAIRIYEKLKNSTGRLEFVVKSP